jgi:hypothetical protein
MKPATKTFPDGRSSDHESGRRHRPAPAQFDHHPNRAPVGVVRARPRLGWGVRRSTQDFALLGLEREVLVKRQQHTLLVATFVQLENPIPRPVWAGVAPGHRHVVRHLLEQPAAG